MFLLPDPILDNKNNEIFSEERAKKHLIKLEGDNYNILGSYENEDLTANYIINEINRLKELNNNWIIELNIQKANGSYYSDFLDYYVNSYNDVTNIIVNIIHSSILKDKINSNNIPSVLISAHFDSAIISKGASDDLASCSVMLELINNIIHSNDILKNKMTFLFNGAEETFLQGAHGFIRYNELSKDIHAFINLESIGAGGKSLIFEYSGDSSWLIKLFQKYIILIN